MPDTRATRLMVTQAWQAVTTQKMKKKARDRDFSQEKLDRAKYNLRKAILEWESPGADDSFGWTEPKKEGFLSKLKKRFGKAE